MCKKSCDVDSHMDCMKHMSTQRNTCHITLIVVDGQVYELFREIRLKIDFTIFWGIQLFVVLFIFITIYAESSWSQSSLMLTSKPDHQTVTKEGICWSKCYCFMTVLNGSCHLCSNVWLSIYRKNLCLLCV